jgi:hypothetical protein
MPLSQPQDREPLHTRTIVIRGYRRHDGLYDIEAHLTDSKARGFLNEHRGYIEAGEPLHGMWMRMTVDDRLTVVACEAASDHTPYAICELAAPNFARLAGLRIKAGFLREAAARIGGTAGCTHLRELLQQMGTTAHQTVFSARGDREAEAIRAATGTALTPEEVDARVAAKFGGSAKIVNTCIAYDEAGPIVERRWPHLYKGPGPDRDPGPGEPVAGSAAVSSAGS